MQKVIVAGRTARDRRLVSLKIPLRSATLVVGRREEAAAIDLLRGYIMSELNVRELLVRTDDRHDTKLQVCGVCGCVDV